MKLKIGRLNVSIRAKANLDPKPGAFDGNWVPVPGEPHIENGHWFNNQFVGNRFEWCRNDKTGAHKLVHLNCDVLCEGATCPMCGATARA